jgi:hypothetical protein
VALLAAKAFHFSDGHAFDSSLGEGFFHIIEFEWLDDGFNFFHGIIFWLGGAPILFPARRQLV